MGGVEVPQYSAGMGYSSHILPTHGLYCTNVQVAEWEGHAAKSRPTIPCIYM